MDATQQQQGEQVETPQLRQGPLHHNLIQDNELFGDNILNKLPDNFRIGFHNVSGISARNDFTDANIIAAYIQANQIDCLAMSETNLNWHDRDVLAKVRARFGSSIKNPMKLQTSASTIAFDSTYQPGGTAIALQGDWISRVCDYGEDPSGDGRWSYMTLQGCRNTAITIVSAYRVCHTIGEKTAYSQQWSLQKQRKILEPKPQQQFYDDLADFISKRNKQEGHGVILTMDANDNILKKDSKLAAFLHKADLVDVHGHLHGYDDDPATHNTGRVRIDYAAASQHLMEYISSAGFEPFGSGKSSSHRPGFLDIQMAAALKGAPAALSSPTMRRLRCADVDNVATYLAEVWKYNKAHNVEERVATLKADIKKHGLTPHITKRLNAVDRDVTDGRLAAENKLPYYRSVPWSPSLKRALAQLGYWKLWLSELSSEYDLNDQRQATIHGLNIPQAKGTPTKTTVHNQLNKARKHLQEVIRNAPKLRREHLEEKITEAELAGDTKGARIRRRIINAEENKRMWNKLGQVMGKFNQGGLSYLLVPSKFDVEGRPIEWEPIFDQEQIQAILLKRNKKHFAQAQGTPFTTPPLTDMFGPAGTSKLADKLLKGEDLPSTEEMGKAVKAILNSLQAMAAEDMDVTVSKEKVAMGFKKWREGTSTSPSGCHLGHYKAMVCDLPEKLEPADDIRDRMLQIQATLMEIAATTGFIYDRWMSIYNAMIEKIKGKPRLEKLRIINLYEADLNLLLGMLYRTLIANGEEMDAFGDEQWGGRKGRTAMDTLFLKLLTYMLSELTLTSLGSFDNDAKACYDRIVMLLALLRARQLGLPKPTSEMIAAISRDAKYRVKTQMGISDDFFTDDEDSPVHGSGQGRKDSPSEWTLMSTMIIKLMKEVSSGASFSDPLDIEEVRRIIDAFVDDATIFENNFDSEDQSPETIAGDLQAAAQWWEELLSATGGKLELDKCFFYLIFWLFNNEGVHRLATKKDFAHIHIIIQSHDPSNAGEEIEITQREPDHAHKTLGFMAHPLADLQDEFDRLKKKANGHACRIRSHSTSMRETKTIYSAYYLSSMKYTLTATNFSRADLEHIQVAPRAAFLNALGFNRYSPSAVAFGPEKMLGLGFKHLLPVQESEKLHFLLGQLRYQGQVGKMMRIAIQWLQLHAGTSFSIMAHPNEPLPHMPANWFLGLRDFLRACNAFVEIDGVYTVTPRRHRDVVLMDHAIKGPWTALELDRINRYRIWQQVETLSDIVSARGDTLGYAPSSNSKLKWARQPEPGPLTLAIWRKFTNTFTIGRTRRLQHPLGAWTDTSTREWTKGFDTDLECLVLKRPEGWAYYFARKNTHGSWKSSSIPDFYDDPPDNMSPVDLDVISEHSIRFFPSNRTPDSPLPRYKPPRRTFQTYIYGLQPWEQHLLTNIEYDITTEDSLLESLLKGTKVLGCSDGGEIYDYGYYGWVIASATAVICSGRGTAYGGPTSSYRSEGYGRLAMMRFVYHYIKFFHNEPLDETTFMSYCDNKTVLDNETNLKTGAWQWSPIWSARSNYDVLRQLELAQDDMPCRVTTDHVAGHQDDKVPWDKLTRPQQLNVLADKLATEQRRELEDEFPAGIPNGPHLPSHTARLYIDNKLQGSKEKHTIATNWATAEIAEYYTGKFGWSQETFQQVNWEAIGTVQAQIPDIQRRFVVKLFIRWLPLNMRQYIQGASSPECIACGQDEHQSHLYQCLQRLEWRTKFLQALETLLKELDTPSTMRKIITHALKEELEDVLISDRQSYCQPNSLLTWTDFFMGRIDRGFETAMDTKYSKKPSHKTTGKIWTDKMIKFLWDQSYEAWKLRCTRQHSSDTHRRDDYLHQEATATTKTFYKQQHKTREYDRAHIFRQPLEIILEYTTSQLQAWVKATKPALVQALKDALSIDLQFTRDIREYFTLRDTI